MSHPSVTKKLTLASDLGSAQDAFENFNSLPDAAWLKAATVCALLACCRNTLWRRVKGGNFPAPIRTSATVIRWRVGDVRKHLKHGGCA